MSTGCLSKGYISMMMISVSITYLFFREVPDSELLIPMPRFGVHKCYFADQKVNVHRFLK